jgi:hypothetical protein
MKDRMGVALQRGDLIVHVTGGGSEVRLRQAVVWGLVGGKCVHVLRHPEELETSDAGRLILLRRGDLMVRVGKYDGDIDKVRERNSAQSKKRGRSADSATV